MNTFEYVYGWKRRNFLTYCEGEGQGQGQGEGQGQGQGQTQGQGQGEQNKPQTFTQDQVNSILKKEKESWRKSTEKQLDELKTLRETLNLTQQQKEQMDTQIKEYESQLLSKEELAKREQTRLQEAAKKQLDGVATERDQWKKLYSDSFIDGGLSKAAKDAKAFNPEQIVMILQGRTRLAAATDESGKATGQYKLEVAWNENGTDIFVPPAEAVKRMKEAPERFGNLFESDAKGGVGGVNNAGSGSKGVTPATLKDPASYRKQREQIIGR